MKLANDFQLECGANDVEDLLIEEAKELTIEELIALEEERREEAEEEDEVEPEKTFMTKGLSEHFSELSHLLAKFETMDPNIGRFAKIERIVQDAFRPY